MDWSAAHYVAPAEELQSGRIHSLTIRLKCRAFHLLEPAPSYLVGASWNTVESLLTSDYQLGNWLVRSQ
jgi:hypothetical protein